MWGFSAHGHASSSPGSGQGGGASSNGGVASSKDPVSGFGYPPTPPIDLKANSNSDNNHQNHAHVATPSHQDYLQHHAPEMASTEAASSGLLPSLTSIETKSDHLMSSLAFPSYSSSVAVAAASRKLHEGNGMSYETSTNVSSPTAYPYFTSPGADLYSVSSPYSSNANSSTTGVFSSRTLQPTRPRSKSRANAGKYIW